jgi:HTH-type transcriptional regulator / antitoxin HigA
MTKAAMNLEAIGATWRAFDKVARIRPIRSNADYERMVGLMNQLLDVVGDNESHQLAELLAIVSDFVADYDAEHFAIPAGEPREVLQFLMDQNEMKQADLDEIVAQPNLSAILKGHRAISRVVAKKLAERFNVGVDAFL